MRTTYPALNSRCGKIRSKALVGEPGLVGIRVFESHLSHQTFLLVLAFVHDSYIYIF